MLECTHVLLGWANKITGKKVFSDETIYEPVSTHYMLTG